MEKTPADHSYKRELFLNQAWQTANFLAKAGFLLLLTPLMVAKWGAEGYGVFALASSLLVTMALLDGGVRSLTRLRLAEALKTNDSLGFRRAYWSGLSTFGTVALLALLVTLLLNQTGWIERGLRLPAGGGVVMVITVGLTGLYMLTTLALEPIAARGNLSMVKALNTVGAVVALPLCAGAILLGASVLPTVILFSLCSILPNLYPLFRENLKTWKMPPGFNPFEFGMIYRTLRGGIWFYLTTVALILKGHGLTFLISALAGPEQAGLFYILLRLTEIIGNVGATASDTSLASLARAETPRDRAGAFAQSWRYTGLFCLHGALGLAILGEPLLRLWMSKTQTIPPGVGCTMAVFGLAAAFSRVVVNASMGLNIVRYAACANLAEAALDIVGALVGYYLGGLPGVLLGGSVGILFLLAPALRVASLCGESAYRAYLAPWLVLAPGLAFCAVAQAAALLTGLYLWYLAAAALSGLVALWQLKRLHHH